MKALTLPVATLALVLALLVGSVNATAVSRTDTPMVRITELEIHPAHLDAYKAILAKEQEASVRLEPGVLMLHSVQLADSPTSIRLLEVYASREAYEAHLESPHFIEYKTSTQKMVKSLRLVNTKPILLCAKSAARKGSDPIC